MLKNSGHRHFRILLAALVISAGAVGIWLFYSFRVNPPGTGKMLSGEMGYAGSGFGDFSVSGSAEGILVYEPLTLDLIFAQDRSRLASFSGDRMIIVIATGDVMPGRSVNTQTTGYGDFKWAFRETAGKLSSADVTLINLESPLVDNCPLVSGGMTFCGDIRHMEGLEHAGVDVVNIANNHIGNYGRAGIDRTTGLIDDAGMQVSGIRQPGIVEVKGIKIAFLGYNDVGHTPEPVMAADPELVSSGIREAKDNNDIVIVSFHWGEEYVRQPNPRQRQLARTAIDAGADLIIGNHPHWYQSLEIYNDKLITYSHGNFVFDQMWSEETKTGVVGKYTFHNDHLVDAEFFPVYIRDYGQPMLLEGDARHNVLDDLLKASLELDQVPH
jgi:hypothetical protein